MGFSEKLKLEVRRRALFRCCICHKAFIEVHHIIPRSERGRDTFENAAPLCASCHDLYGGNPDKRKRIRQMRDHWYELMDQKKGELIRISEINKIISEKEEKHDLNTLKARSMFIYHVVFEHEGFEESARILDNLVKTCQEKFPNHNRILFLDIDGHKNIEGVYDTDMIELMKYLILGFLMEYLTEVNIPFGIFQNKNKQKMYPQVPLLIFQSKEELLNFKKKQGLGDNQLKIVPKTQSSN